MACEEFQRVMTSSVNWQHWERYRLFDRFQSVGGFDHESFGGKQNLVILQEDVANGTLHVSNNIGDAKKKPRASGHP